VLGLTRNRFLVTFLLLCWLPYFGSAAFAAKKVVIGVLVDGAIPHQHALLKSLRHELSTLLGSKYDINVPEGKVLSASWTLDGAKNNYLKLKNDDDVEIIIAIGVLSTSVVLKVQPYPKPVIALGVIDPIAQNVTPTQKGTSGINNLAYVLFDNPLNNDLVEFHQLFPFKKVGIILDGQLHRSIFLGNPFEPILSIQKELNTLGIEHVWLPIENSVNDPLDKLEEVDAVYLGYLGRFEGQEKKTLITEINKRKLPSFSPAADSIDAGVLASASPKKPMNKIIRRLVLNVESILDGNNPSTLPVHLRFDKKLTLNMQTAREIEFSPTFSTLSRALLVNDLSPGGAPLLSLENAIHGAVSNNIDLKIQASKVEVAELDVKRIKTNYLPSISVSHTGTQIDEARATSSFGQQAEKTSSASLKFEQLLFSESQFAGVEIKKSLLKVEQDRYRQLQLDIILKTATAYFDVLRARTATIIQKENVNLFRQYLDLAKQREIAGYSGLSDVYHWESQLANARTQYLSAVNNFKLTKIQLNEILNRPLNEAFDLEDVAKQKDGFKRYLTGAHKNYIDTPAALEEFTAFSVTQALLNAPEIAQLDASIQGQERQLKSLRKKRYIPNVAFVAEKKRVFSRDGAGSDIEGVDPEDDSWSASINLSLPLFEGGEINLEARQAKVLILQLKHQRLQTQQAIELRVRAALLGLTTQAVNLKSSQRAAHYSDKSLSLVQGAYKTGKASVVELSDAQNIAISANQKALNSVYEFLTELMKTERAVGHFSFLDEEGVKSSGVNRFNQSRQNLNSSGVN